MDENNTQTSSNKMQEYENELQQNYNEIVRVQGQLDTITAAAAKMRAALQDLMDINSVAYNQAGSVSLWKGKKNTETIDIITLDMQTEYNLYYEAIGHIKNSLEGKQRQLEEQLKELRKENGVLYYMIGLCAQDIKTTIDE